MWSGHINTLSALGLGMSSTKAAGSAASAPSLTKAQRKSKKSKKAQAAAKKKARQPNSKKMNKAARKAAAKAAKAAQDAAHSAFGPGVVGSGSSLDFVAGAGAGAAAANQKQKRRRASGSLGNTLTASERNRRADRASRFASGSSYGTSVGTPQLFTGFASSGAAVTTKQPRNKRRRVAAKTAAMVEPSRPSTAPLVGTSRSIHKQYTRIASDIDPSTVRPLSVLRKALADAKRQWREHHDYKHAWEQLKAIRQDLTVQGIRNRFTVHVYETHARVALEEGDLNEFNQCQTRLVGLYEEGHAGHEEEFFAYRMLYALHQRDHVGLGQLLRKALSHPKLGSHSELAANEHVRYAVKVIQAVRWRNYHLFFTLYADPPGMSGYLLDFLVWRMRKLGYSCIIAAYLTVRVSFVQSELCLADMSETRRFLGKVGAVHPRRKEANRAAGLSIGLRLPDATDQATIDCKASRKTFPLSEAGLSK